MEIFHFCKALLPTREEEERAEDMGLPLHKVVGMWVPYSFRYDSIVQFYQHVTDDDEIIGTKVHLDVGSIFVIDTPYEEFSNNVRENLNPNTLIMLGAFN